MLLSLLNTAIDFLILVFLARLSLPNVHLFSFNPFIAWVFNLMGRIIGTLRVAIPFSERVIAGIVLILLVFAKGAVLFRGGDIFSTLSVGLVHFSFNQPPSPLLWAGIGLIHFVFFWTTLSLTVVLLRVWNRGSFPYPGRLGGLLLFLTRPLSGKPARIALPLLLLLLFAVCSALFGLASETAFFDMAESVRQTTPVNVALAWDPADPLQLFNACVCIFISSLSQIPLMISGFMMFIVIFSILALLFRRKDWIVFSQEGFAIVMGRLGSNVLGFAGLNFMPVVVYFALGMIASFLNIVAFKLFLTL